MAPLHDSVESDAYWVATENRRRRFGWDREQIAFWMMLVVSLLNLAWAGGRLYFYLMGDVLGERRFVHHPWVLPLYPISMLAWFTGYVVIGVTLLERRQFSRYGIATIVMSSIPAIPLSLIVYGTYWQFFTSM